MTRLCLPIVALLLTACGAGARAQQPSDAAARIGDRVVTVQDLDENWRQADAAAKMQAEQALYDGRKAALDRIVAAALIDQAAKAKGVSADAYVKEEVGRRRKAVGPADIETFYKANQAQMQNRPLEDMRDAIREFLDGQADTKARADLVAELRKAGPAVRVSLDPPRQQVAVASHDPARGPASAPVTLIEFSDYQCPFCNRVTPTMTRLLDTYGERLRIVWKDFPLVDIHPLASKAAEAAWCAGEQGKYWEYHDRLFANQSALGTDALKEHAKAVGLEVGGFNTCLDSSRHAERVRAGAALGRDLGVDSTPTAFINGRRVTGAQPYDVFAAVIDEELERAK